MVRRLSQVSHESAAQRQRQAEEEQGHRERTRLMVKKARSLPPSECRAKALEAKADIEKQLAAAHRETAEARELEDMKRDVLAELEGLELLDRLGKGGTPTPACAASSPIERAHCEWIVATVLLSAARAEADRALASEILTQAGLVSASAEASLRSMTTNLRQRGADLKEVEALGNAIRAEGTRVEVARYVRTSTTVAVVEVVGPIETYARVDLGGPTGRDVWCAADKVRGSLVAGGIPEARVVVSATSSKKQKSSGTTGIVIEVRPALREEQTVDAAAACRGGRTTGTKWTNPFIAAQEKETLLHSADEIERKIREAIRLRHYADAKSLLESLAPVMGKAEGWGRLVRDFSDACAGEASRLVRGEKGPDGPLPFSEVAACAMPADIAVHNLESANQSCECDDEFKARDCASSRQIARNTSKNPVILQADLSPDLVSFGTYDFAAKRFPVALRGTLRETKYGERCELKVPDDCKGSIYYRQQASDANVIRIAMPGDRPAWQGFLPVPEEERARDLKAHFDVVAGEVLFVIGGTESKTALDVEMAELKKETLAGIERARTRRGNGTPDRLKEISEAERCVRASKARYAVVTGEPIVVGVRLTLPSAKEPVLEWPGSTSKDGLH